MTTKRKQILKAIALAGSTTMDDLALATGLERKNLHDNIKATIKDDLCERIRDDVTGQPAYKLTPKGRAWLENDKDDSGSGKPKPGVGQNPGSIASDLSSVAGGVIRADLLAEGNAAKAPPKPDRMPVEVSADEIKAAQRNADLEVRLDSAGRSIVEFCEWLAKKAKVRCPLNLHECKGVITDVMQENETSPSLLNENAYLRQQLEEWFKHGSAYGVLTPGELSEVIQTRNNRIADLESNAELPLSPQPDSQLGYAVMEYSDQDIEKNILKLSEARDKAAIHSLRTGQKTAVFAIVDRVENVSVEWAA